MSSRRPAQDLYVLEISVAKFSWRLLYATVYLLGYYYVDETSPGAYGIVNRRIDENAP